MGVERRLLARRTGRRRPHAVEEALRVWRILKEQFLWVRTFRNVEELRLALQDFRNLYNRSWILQKHGYLAPSQVRSKLASRQEVAA